MLTKPQRLPAPGSARLAGRSLLGPPGHGVTPVDERPVRSPQRGSDPRHVERPPVEPPEGFGT